MSDDIGKFKDRISDIEKIKKMGELIIKDADKITGIVVALEQKFIDGDGIENTITFMNFHGGINIAKGLSITLNDHLRGKIPDEYN